MEELLLLGREHGKQLGFYLAFFPLFRWLCHTGNITSDLESMEVLSLPSSSGFSFQFHKEPQRAH